MRIFKKQNKSGKNLDLDTKACNMQLKWINFLKPNYFGIKQVTPVLLGGKFRPSYPAIKFKPLWFMALKCLASANGIGFSVGAKIKQLKWIITSLVD